MKTINSFIKNRLATSSSKDDLANAIRIGSVNDPEFKSIMTDEEEGLLVEHGSEYYDKIRGLIKTPFYVADDEDLYDTELLEKLESLNWNEELSFNDGFTSSKGTKISIESELSSNDGVLRLWRGDPSGVFTVYFIPENSRVIS